MNEICLGSAEIFRAGCARGELCYQRCRDCGAVQLHTREHCARCHGLQVGWAVSGGLGVIYSHTTVHRAPTPVFRDRVPYVIALVDFAEGFRLLLNVVGDARAEVRIGEAVRVVFGPGIDGQPWPQALRCAGTAD